MNDHVGTINGAACTFVTGLRHVVTLFEPMRAGLSHWTRGSTKAGLQTGTPILVGFVKKADQVEA